MFYSIRERPEVMKGFLNKNTIEDYFKRLRETVIELKEIEEEMNIDQLNEPQKSIIQTRRAALNDTMIILGILEATVFNVAEQNELLTKLIRLYNAKEAQQKGMLKELTEKINKHEKEIEETKNDPFIKQLEEYYKKMSETTTE